MHPQTLRKYEREGFVAKAARAMRHWVLPEFDMRASIIRARCTASEAARTD